MGLGRYRISKGVGSSRLGKSIKAALGAGRKYSDHNYVIPPGITCIMPSAKNKDGTYGIDESLFDVDPPGGDALTMVSGDLKIVFGVFWNPDVASVWGIKMGKFGAFNDIEESFVKPVAETIASHTVGNVNLVGGYGSTTPDVVVVGELPSLPCGVPNYPYYCMCGQSTGLRTMANSWFSNNGYPNSEYDIRVSIMLHCTGPIESVAYNTGNTIALSLNPDMGETETPFPGVPGGPLDITNYKSLSDGHFIQLTVHEILHNLGLEHSANSFSQTGDIGETIDGICFNRHKLDGPTQGCTQHCRCAGLYEIDTISIMNQVHYFNNYKKYKELHPSAAQKHLIGSFPGQTGPPWIPDENVVTLEVHNDGSADNWEGYLWAHDRPGPLADPVTQQILDNNEPLLIKIRRDAPSLEFEDDDTMGNPRYYFLSYRRHAQYSPPFTEPENPYFEHGALMIEWGPTCTYCDSFQVKYGIMPLAKGPVRIIETDGENPYDFEAYGQGSPTEHGSPPYFPQLSIRILDFDYNDTLDGGDWIKLRITHTFED